jgi:hypothetical protein
MSIVGGLESLYLHCGMSGTGGWRYSIGAMENGRWPRALRDPLQVFDSMNGSADPDQIAWGGLCDGAALLADKFVAPYPAIVDAARVPNVPRVAWYRRMLAASEPDGMLVYYFDYKLDPRPEFWDSRPPGYLELPPGLRPDAA